MQQIIKMNDNNCFVILKDLTGVLALTKEDQDEIWLALTEYAPSSVIFLLECDKIPETNQIIVFHDEKGLVTRILMKW